MAAHETILDAVNEWGDGVRVGFQRIGDRYSHTLYAVSGGKADAIVQSVDDDDVQGWPLSPPVQELREATDPDGNRTLLLMGAAAAGHWSASAAIKRRGDRDPFLALDVAVRLARPPAYLGAAYDADDFTQWDDLPGGLALPHRDGRVLWITAALDQEVRDRAGKNPLESLRASRDAERPRRRRFEPTAPLPSTYPATYRWQYEVALGAAVSSPAGFPPAP